VYVAVTDLARGGTRGDRPACGAAPER